MEERTRETSCSLCPDNPCYRRPEQRRPIFFPTHTMPDLCEELELLYSEAEICKFA